MMRGIEVRVVVEASREEEKRERRRLVARRAKKVCQVSVRAGVVAVVVAARRVC